ncbi:MAG: cupin domain-containing protein [Deltaproteobacteria bacterium]|nr:MAG: cupin domain-containing protein [Deltaproteobacteria bacterium]
MKHINCGEATAFDMVLPGARSVTFRPLIGPEAAPSFIMLMLEVAPGGNTPDHNHEWEEEIFIVAGEGKLKTAEGEKRLRVGDALIIDRNMQHQFFNTGNGPMQFICVIPK